ncbi:molybdenum cofactor sulfurase [Copromyces sp. CBS 386.78]|nr:molybdenum cofactor sulfurase [Copromyces sp. CBS 386.78]
MGSLYTDFEGYNADVERIREEEYPMLTDSLYLDHAGTTPYPKSLMDRFAHEMTTNLFGNPHSASASSQLSTQRIQDIRLRALQFFNADPADFDLVFVANATAGIKLVTDAMRCLPTGFDYAYHEASHTSLVGVREEATSSVCLHDRQVEDWLAGDCPFKEEEEEERPILFAYPAQSNMDGRRFPLSWSSQVRQTRETKITRKTYTLLDAAALVSSSPLDLSNAQTAPDFVVLSFYKIFGFPDLGALIVRKDVQHVFSSRRYFGGGTVDMVVCLKEQWHAPKDGFLHERLEDGTLPIHSIIALDVAMDVHARLFGSMDKVAAHTGFLAKRLYWGLKGLRHANGEEVCAIYSPDPDSPQNEESGPVVTFNIRNAQGTWISLAEVEKLAMLKGIHIRTGGVCNPGGVASALGLEPWEMKQNFSSGFRCGTDNDIMSGKPTGIIRASLGAMSTVADVDGFVHFVDEFYREDTTPLSIPVSPSPDSDSDTKLQPPPLQNIPQLFVKSIIVYPIKSCAGFPVPPAIDWEVRPEGLAWDREWCLVHRGSGQALSQKRYPRMALVRPNLDFTRGELQVSYAGDIPPSAAAGLPSSISVPLSKNPKMFMPKNSGMSPRVCGEEITAQTYASAQINDFFTTVLGVPCVLARFPPGGQGKGMTRHAKAHLQRHQQQASQPRPQPQPQPRPAVSVSAKPKKPSKQAAMMPGAFPSSAAQVEVEVGVVETPPSPPDSDTEQQRSRTATRTEEDMESQGQGQPNPRRILLSNESPILAITTTSVDALNESIVAALNPPSSAAAKGPIHVSDAVFRANLILSPIISSTTSSTSELNPYEEDGWSAIHILNSSSSSSSSSSAGNKFQMLGSCRRCHMVCIDQSTGEKSEGGEPFVTLTKTRRFEGKVFFGVHMGLAEEEEEREEGDVGSGRRVVRVRVGDVVLPSVGLN